MKNFILLVLRFSGLVFIFREFLQRNKTTILLYHDIDKNTAYKTFNYLKKRYNIISLEFYIDSVLSGNKSNIPKKALIITFDDGHIGNFDLLETAKKLEIPITIFLCTEIINTNRHFWFLEKGVPIHQLKLKSNSERISTLKEHDFLQTKEYDQIQALQAEHIQKMKSTIDFQAHTQFHPMLPRCSDKESWEEIYLSKKQLEEKYDLDIYSFAFPNGNYSDREIEYVKKAGYKSALTTDFGFNSFNTDLYRLKRLSMNDTSNINELAVRASGLWGFLKTRNGRKIQFGYTKNINSNQ